MVQDDSAAWEPAKDSDNTFDMVQEINAGAPNIKVMGIGGGGSNAVSRMFKDKLPVVEYFSVNTDAQHLFRCDVSHRLAIGQNLTRGLGAGAGGEGVGDPVPGLGGIRVDVDACIEGLAVGRARLQQVRVVAGSDDPAAVHHDHAGDQFEHAGSQRVGDHQHGATPDEPAEHFEDRVLAGGVDGRGGLVEHQDGRVAENCSCQGDSLSLSTREPAASFADGGIESVGELLDEVGHQRPLSCFEDLVPRRVGSTEPDVLEHRVIEQQGFLCDDPDLLSQFQRVDFPDVDPVDAD